jgi:hypothetical protein
MTAEDERLEEEELLELARDTTDRLKLLITKLEAFATVPADTGARRRATDRDKDDNQRG